MQPQPTIRDRGLTLGVAIHRRKPHSEWRTALAAEPDLAVRAVAEEYLRAIYLRARTLRELAEKDGFTGPEAVERWRKHRAGIARLRETASAPPERAGQAEGPPDRGSHPSKPRPLGQPYADT